MILQHKNDISFYQLRRIRLWKKRDIEGARNNLFEKHLRRRSIVDKVLCEGIARGSCEGMPWGRGCYGNKSLFYDNCCVAKNASTTNLLTSCNRLANKQNDIRMRSHGLRQLDDDKLCCELSRDLLQVDCQMMSYNFNRQVLA